MDDEDNREAFARVAVTGEREYECERECERECEAVLAPIANCKES